MRLHSLSATEADLAVHVQKLAEIESEVPNSIVGTNFVINVVLSGCEWSSGARFSGMATK